MDEIEDDVMRRSAQLIETCGDLQHISHAALSQLCADNDFFLSVRLVLRGLDSLRKVVEKWYGGVTDIFHHKLVDVFSRYLYKDVHRVLLEIKWVASSLAKTTLLTPTQRLANPHPMCNCYNSSMT
jgi:hypothetical protein